MKKKICKNPSCKKQFEPERFAQAVCSWQCGIERSRDDAKKKKAKEEKEARKKHREDKERILRKPELEAKLKRILHEIVRLVDSDLPCVCCGEFANERDFALGGDYDAGHYRSVGSLPYLKLDLRNIHRQRKYCNNQNGRGGNYKSYELGLIARYGNELVDWLNGPHQAPHHTRDDLRNMIVEYRKILNIIRKGDKSVREFYRIELRKLPE